MEKLGLLDLAIAPLTWLERSRGWKRRRLVAIYLLVVMVVGVFGWRELSLWRLPNIGEPFDEEKFGTVVVPDSDNAMIAYREAARLLKPLDRKVFDEATKNWNFSDWSQVAPLLAGWLEENRAALELWLQGADRPDALLAQPKDLVFSTRIDVVQALREFHQLAMLESSRLERAGDLEGAWRMIRGSLRSSRHAGMHGVAVQRWIGRSIQAQARPRVHGWMENPKVTPDLLRRAIGDMEACVAMTAPNSEMVRAEYFSCRAGLNRPDEWIKYGVEGLDGEGMWYNHIAFVPPARRFLVREPERSLRVFRLITAGLLAQCDRPRPIRPKLFSAKYMVYDVDSRTPPIVASITPEELAAWADRSAYQYLAAAFNTVMTACDFEMAAFDQMRLRMAERIYEIERGKPATTYGDLLGPYLKSLPDGIEPGDRVTAPAAPQ